MVRDRSSAPLFQNVTLAATVVAVFVRAIDIESWALLVPGGLLSRVRQGFGPRAARVAAAATLVERLLLSALACVVAGHYVAGVAVMAIGGWRFSGLVRSEDFATLLAVAAVGLLWIRVRIGRDVDRDTVQRSVWIGIGILMLPMVWGVITVLRGAAAPLAALVSFPPPTGFTGSPLVDTALTCMLGSPSPCRRSVAVRCWRAPRTSFRRRVSTGSDGRLSSPWRLDCW
jgi:hypothetical protein